MVAWYRLQADLQLPQRAAPLAEQLHVHPVEILIRDPRARWGSCDPSGTLRFSERIVQAPLTLVDYVVAHELVHLVHRGHPSILDRPREHPPDYELLVAAGCGTSARAVLQQARLARAKSDCGDYATCLVPKAGHGQGPEATCCPIAASEPAHGAAPLAARCGPWQPLARAKPSPGVWFNHSPSAI